MKEWVDLSISIHSSVQPPTHPHTHTPPPQPNKQTQNFSYGGNISTTSIEIVERLTRYWIIFQHHLNNNEDFVRDDGKQNTEQLTNTLVPLKENYKYAHMLGQTSLCRHEAEFHAYGVLLTGDLKQSLRGGPGVSQSPEVRLALDVLACVETNNFARFFHHLRGAPYIFACLMAKYVDSMRETALKTWSSVFNPGKTSHTTFTKEEIIHALCLSSEEELYELTETHPWLQVGGNGRVTLRKATKADQELLSPTAMAGEEEDEEKLKAKARKAKAALILKSSFPYVPFIEAKAAGVRFRDLTRGIKGALCLSTPGERLATAASSSRAALPPPPSPVFRPVPLSPVQQHRQQEKTPQRPTPSPKSISPFAPAPAPTATAEEGSSKKKRGSLLPPLSSLSSAPAPAAAAAAPSAATLPSPFAPAQQAKEGEEDDGDRRNKRRAPLVAPAPETLSAPVFPPLPQPPPAAVAKPPIFGGVPAHPPPPPQQPGGGGGLLSKLGGWVSNVPGLRALGGGSGGGGERRETKKKQDEEAQQQAAAREAEKRAVTARKAAADLAVRQKEARKQGAARLHHVVSHAMKRQVFQQWVALIRHERLLEEEERARFEATLSGAFSDVAASSLFPLPLGRGPLAELQSATQRRKKRRASSLISRTTTPSARAVPPLNLPQLVGGKLWSRHERQCLRVLNPRKDPAPPALIGWKLLLQVTEQDPAGGWLVGSLTHARQTRGPSSLWKKAGGSREEEDGGVLWKAEHKLQQRVDGKTGKTIDLALCVKKATASHGGLMGGKEVAHALLFHLPEPSYAAALRKEDGSSRAYWRGRRRELQQFVNSATPGVPLLLCLGAEALAALPEEEGEKGVVDVRQKVAKALGLGQRGFWPADEEAVGFDWDVLVLPAALGRAGVESEGGVADQQARAAMEDALGFLAETSPTPPLVVRETLVSVVGGAVRQALWRHEEGKGRGEEDLRKATAEGCQKVVNAALADVRAQLCAPELAVAPWPLAEFAEGGGVARALWWDMAGVGGAGSSTKLKRSGLFGSSSKSKEGPGLPVGWNDWGRLLQLENLLKAVELPAPEAAAAQERDPVRWVERYLSVLRTEGAAQGWSMGASPQLAQFATELALAARAAYQEGGGGRGGGVIAPWNRLFTAMVVDRLSLACGSEQPSSSSSWPPLRWAYRLHTAPTADDPPPSLGGASLREYEEMDLDEGHRHAYADFFFYRKAAASRQSGGGGVVGGWEGNEVPTNRRRRRRAGRPSYALDVEVDQEEGGGGGRKRARKSLEAERPQEQQQQEPEQEDGMDVAEQEQEEEEEERAEQPAEEGSLAALSQSLAQESKAWGGAMSFLKAFL